MRLRLVHSAIILAAVLALGAAAIPSPAPVISFPDGYRQWTHVKTTLVGAHHPGFARNGGFHHFYANAKAMEGYRTGTFPDGSVLIDDGLEALETTPGLHVEGPRRRLAVMVKDGSAFAATAGWGFESFSGDSRSGALSDAGRAACVACHQQAKPDLVFSEYRK